MARSVSELHKAYKSRGGKKSFAEFRKATAPKATKKSTAAATKKVNKASKMVSGKLEKNLRKPIKRKYST